MSAPDITSDLREELFRQAPEFGLGAAGKRLDALVLYLAELSRWREAVNLVGNLSPRELASHALESALGAQLLDPDDNLLDIGSGAGFPGVPLGLWGIRVTLLEPRERRAAFLRHAIRSFPGLNVTVLAGRVETLREAEWTAASTRAVGSLGERVGDARFLKEKGRLLVWTSDAGRLGRELAPRFVSKSNLPVPGSRRRQIAIFEKCSTWNRGD